MSTTAAGAPKLSGMKFLVESIISTDETGTLMLIGDQGAHGTHYVLKSIRRESKDDDIYLAIARAACEASKKLGHPSILKYHDFRTKRSWFRVARGELLMEYVKGRSLDQIQHERIAPWVLVFRELAVVIGHLHRRGVHYGDLKPSHVMLSRSGQVKAFGYGLSMLTDAQRQSFCGTPQYFAPEQAQKKVIDERTDLYNLGATMYHILTGQPANRGGRLRGEGGKIPTPVALNPKVTTALNNLIVSCLQTEPDKRPSDAFEVQQRLETIAKEVGSDPEELKDLAVSSANLKPEPEETEFDSPDE